MILMTVCILIVYAGELQVNNCSEDDREQYYLLYMQSAMAAQYSTTTTSLESIITGASMISVIGKKIYLILFDSYYCCTKVFFQGISDSFLVLLHIHRYYLHSLYYIYIASDHLFNQAKHLVTRSAAAISKLQNLEQKLQIDNKETKQQCLQVRNVHLQCD